MVSKAGATPASAQSHSAQQIDQGKQMTAQLGQESRTSGKSMVIRQGQGQAKKPIYRSGPAIATKARSKH